MDFLAKHYRIVDIVCKVVRVGSVGTRCWVICLEGNHDKDPLFLQVKEAQHSVLEPYTINPYTKTSGDVWLPDSASYGEHQIFFSGGANWTAFIFISDNCVT